MFALCKVRVATPPGTAGRQMTLRRPACWRVSGGLATPSPPERRPAAHLLGHRDAPFLAALISPSSRSAPPAALAVANTSAASCTSPKGLLSLAEGAACRRIRRARVSRVGAPHSARAPERPRAARGSPAPGQTPTRTQLESNLGAADVRPCTRMRCRVRSLRGVRRSRPRVRVCWGLHVPLAGARGLPAAARRLDVRPLAAVALRRCGPVH